MKMGHYRKGQWHFIFPTDFFAFIIELQATGNKLKLVGSKTFESDYFPVIPQWITFC